MPSEWRIFPFDAERIARLERAAGVPSIVAQLLISRGIESLEDARRFLDCKLTGLRDPQELPGVNVSAELLAGVIERKEPIVVYGDYDADGMTGAAILYRALKLLGATVKYHVPCRLDDGYGLNADAVRKLAADGARWIVTVDCGITSVAEVALAKELGLGCIVTDHHEMADELPAADAIVHPRVPEGEYPFGDLCGSGVALKLAWALCRRVAGTDKVTEAMRAFLLQAVGLAALGTVADVVPLTDENRILVRHGLESLRHRPTLGIAELLRVTELDKNPALTSEDIAFSLAPRINAAGRLGQAMLAVELLVTDSKERAAALAEYIHELNESRQSLERRIYRDAHSQAKENFDPQNDPALVLASDDWHVGVIGIVAGRLAEKYAIPVVIISHDPHGAKPSTGSGRSARGIQLQQAFAASAEHLVGFGGHAAAAGLRIEPESVDAFRSALCDHLAAQKTGAASDEDLAIDAEAPFAALTQQTVQQIESLAPFGQGNKRPLFCTGDVEIAGEVKRIGGGGRHLSVTFSQHGKKIRAVAFGRGDWHDELTRVDGPLEIAFRPVINSFRGRRSVEMHLADWRVRAT